MQDASGLIHVEGDLFLVAEDNSDSLSIFQLSTIDQDNIRFRATGQKLDLGEGLTGNSDFESLAGIDDRTGRRYYVTGSYKKPRGSRLLCFRTNGTALASPPDAVSFEPMSDFKGQKIDIEALTSYREGILLVGFRKPTCHGRALAMFFDVATSEKCVRNFDLRQRVFRDCVRIDDSNFLFLAGPESGESPRRQIYLWNGRLDAMRPKKCRIDLGNYRAESICVRNGSAGQGSLEILIGTDESRSKSGKFQLGYVKVNSVRELVEQENRLRKVTVVV